MYRKKSLPMPCNDILSVGGKFTDSLVSEANTKDFFNVSSYTIRNFILHKAIGKFAS